MSGDELLPHPAPRQVKAPWLVCQGVRDGLSTFVVTAAARDRTGLLLALTDCVRRFDERLVIEGGHARVTEDYFDAFLLVRHRSEEGVPPARLGEALRELAGRPPVGWQIPVARVAPLSVRGPDRPGFLNAVLEVIAAQGANIARFESETLGPPPAGDGASPSPPLPAEGECLLSFVLELPRAAVAGLAELRGRLADLAPGRVTVSDR